MAEIKKGWKLLRYGYGLKLNLFISAMFLVIGILMLCIGESGVLMGTLYILLAPTMLIQIESSLLYSGMAAASPGRKLLELYMPDFLTIITGVLGYVVAVGTALFWASTGAESAETCIQTMLVSSIVVAILLIYFGAAYKFFIVSVLMFGLGLMIGISGGVITIHFIGGYFTLFTAALVSFVLVVLGIVISCLLRRVLYKKMISPLAAGMSLRKAMQ